MKKKTEQVDPLRIVTTGLYSETIPLTLDTRKEFYEWFNFTLQRKLKCDASLQARYRLRQLRKIFHAEIQELEEVIETTKLAFEAAERSCPLDLQLSRLEYELQVKDKYENEMRKILKTGIFRKKPLAEDKRKEIDERIADVEKEKIAICESINNKKNSVTYTAWKNATINLEEFQTSKKFNLHQDKLSKALSNQSQISKSKGEKFEDSCLPYVIEMAKELEKEIHAKSSIIILPNVIFPRVPIPEKATSEFDYIIFEIQAKEDEENQITTEFVTKVLRVIECKSNPTDIISSMPKAVRIFQFFSDERQFKGTNLKVSIQNIDYISHKENIFNSADEKDTGFITLDLDTNSFRNIRPSTTVLTREKDDIVECLQDKMFFEGFYHYMCLVGFLSPPHSFVSFLMENYLTMEVESNATDIALEDLNQRDDVTNHEGLETCHIDNECDHAIVEGPIYDLALEGWRPIDTGHKTVHELIKLKKIHVFQRITCDETI